MRRFLSLLRGTRTRLAVAAAAGTGTVLAGAGLLATGAYLISRASLHPPILDLTVAIVGVRFFGISRAVLRYAERIAAHDAALHLTARLRVRAFTAVERLSPGGIERDRAADLLGRVGDDLDDLQQALVRSVVPAAVTLLVAVGAGAAAAVLHRPSGLILAACLAVTAAATAGVALRLGRRRARHLGPGRTALTAAMVDLVEGCREAAVLGRAADLAQAAVSADGELQKASRRTARSSGVGSALTVLGTGAAVCLVVRLGVEAAASGAMNPLLLGALALLAMASFEPVAALPGGLDHLESGLAAAAGLVDLEDRPDPVTEHAEPASLPHRPEVCLGGIWMRHRDDGPWALRDFHLDLAPGRRVALVGESGAGKSSVAAVLLRFRDPAAGVYTIGGIDAGLLRGEEVRRMVGLAGEDAPLVPGSVRHNLLLADPEADDARLLAVLDGVSLDGWLDSLPDGLGTRIGPGGRPMSGGEQRRISLARAMLAGFPILVADEPTAGLDSDTAAAVVEQILGLDCGLLLITHGTEGLEAMDEIVVLEDGAVAERGTHRSLLAGGGLYRRLWEARSPGNLPPR